MKTRKVNVRLLSKEIHSQNVYRINTEEETQEFERLFAFIANTKF
jgi:hypothetical protein